MKKQYYILICGPSGSGKTFLADEIQKVFPDLEHINGDPMRDFLREQYTYFTETDFSTTSTDYKKRSAQRIVRNYIQNSIQELLKADKSLLHDAVSLRASTRRFRIEEAHKVNSNILTIILGMNTDDTTILERLQARDNESRHTSQWETSYQQASKSTYEEPRDNEADYVFTITEKNQREVLQELHKILI
jgi:adenylate kinase family enzyme